MDHTFRPGDIVTFRHPQTGVVRRGLYTCDYPVHNAIGVNVPFTGPIVVHRDNLIDTQIDASLPAEPK